MTGTDSEHVDELLDAFRSGELDAGRAARVAAHLEGCARCREELGLLATWSAAVERGFAARREASSELEPDWAAQRAAIVARTSGRAAADVRRGGLWRWAPQVALVALAALIVGIVWRENPREGEPPPALEEPASAFEPSVPVAPGVERDGADEDRASSSVDRAEAPSERMAADRQAPAAPPPAELGKAREAEEAPGRAANAEAVSRERQEALADQAPEPRADALLRAGDAVGLRFERAAREALAARDTAAARRALALWSDSLPGEERSDPTSVALADSLEALLDGE